MNESWRCEDRHQVKLSAVQTAQIRDGEKQAGFYSPTDNDNINKSRQASSKESKKEKTSDHPDTG